ncbi:hypothetical protein BU15DRAFT_77782 [Melanogaster broomeanus]|nr:hypothetical protein BU15DRAFT_77782 [Melanogaster broomeanus]
MQPSISFELLYSLQLCQCDKYDLRLSGISPGRTALEYQRNGFMKPRKRPLSKNSQSGKGRSGFVFGPCVVLMCPLYPTSSSNILELSIPLILPLLVMDGLSSATVIIAIIETGVSVVAALVKYGASVKNANRSCQRLIKEIQTINALARDVETFVRKLSTDTASDSFCRSWIDPESPAMYYKGELDKLMEKLSRKQDVGRAKLLIRRLVWPLKESEIKAAIESFERYIKHLNLAVTLTRVDAWITISKQGEEHGALLKGAIDSNELQKMYDWMDVVICTTKYEITLGQRQDGTCKWLLDLKRYADWRSSQNAFFRVSGKPGAGKSVLISVVIESLSKTETNGGVLVYFYCDFRRDRTTHAFEVIRSLLTQLLRKSKDAWLPLFGDLVDRKSNGSPPPVDLEILYQLLLKAVRLHDRPVLVIYALDECKDYVKLTELLARLHNEGSCRVFCTSRPLLDAPKTFSDLPTLDLHVMRAKTLCDMKLHIEKEVAKYDKLASLRDEIIPSLLKKADGMILERIDKKKFGGQIAKSILLWLVGALKPLNLKLLTEGVTFDIQRSEKSNGEGFLSNEDFLNVCGSLVRYDRKDDVVSLSHFSVKEYLFHAHLRNGALSRYHISPPIADSHLVMLCIDYFRTPQMVPEFQSCFGPFNWIDSLLPNWAYHNTWRISGATFRSCCENRGTSARTNAIHASTPKRPSRTIHGTRYGTKLHRLLGTPSFLKTYLDHLETIRLTDTTDGNSPLAMQSHTTILLVQNPSELGLRYQPPMSQIESYKVTQQGVHTPAGGCSHRHRLAS